MSLKEADLLSISHFWFEKGDLERMVGFNRDKMREDYPAILKAWEDYKASKLILGAVIRDALGQAHG